MPVRVINKVLEGRPHVVDALKNGEIHLVFNTTDGAPALTDSLSIRRTALTLKVPYYTTMAGAAAATEAIAALQAGSLEVAPLQSYSLWLAPPKGRRKSRRNKDLRKASQNSAPGRTAKRGRTERFADYRI